MLPTSARQSALPIISQPFKRAQEGLFHGKMKRSGNSVPHSKHKTRRTWLPNVQSKRLTLDVTGETHKLKVTARALRCIEKAGSLDNYVLNTNPDLLGMEGMRLRVLVRERLEKEATVKAEANKQQQLKAKEERRIAYKESVALKTSRPKPRRIKPSPVEEKKPMGFLSRLGL